jgi:cytochrome P450
MQDDVLPLSAPITLADGTQTTQLVIAQGTDVSMNSELMNRSRALWGDDAGVFRPERWIEGLPVRAQEISGYKHIMTFLDGPKGYILAISVFKSSKERTDMTP